MFDVNERIASQRFVPISKTRILLRDQPPGTSVFLITTLQNYMDRLVSGTSEVV